MALCQSAMAQMGRSQQEKQVVLRTVEFANEQRTIEAVGTAEAIRSVTLYPAVADLVTGVHFTPGDQVEKGQLLLSLDARKQTVEVERAKLQLADAQRTLQRLIESQQRGAVAQSDLDDARTARDLAEVALKEAQVNLDDRRVVAPFDGIVGITDVEVGDRITTQTAVTTLDDRSELYINFRAPEASLAILLGQPDIILVPWTDRNRELTASIAQLDSRVEASDRTLRARAILNNRDDQFRPGMSFRVNLQQPGARYAAIPESALLWGATGAYVWTAVDGKAQKVDVEVMQRLRGSILVDGPLREGDMLIAEGIQRLRAGQTVVDQAGAGASR